MLTTTVCAALSAAGLAVAFLTAFRRRFAAATRIAAYSLVPVGLAMTGLAELGGKVGKAVGTWASDLVLKPTVWAGFGVLACAVVLWVIARMARRGKPGRKERAERRAAARAGGSAGALAPRTQAAPALGTSPASSASPASAAPVPSPARAKSAGSGSGSGSRAAGGDADDFSDIEAILKKHGI